MKGNRVPLPQTKHKRQFSNQNPQTKHALKQFKMGRNSWIKGSRWQNMILTAQKVQFQKWNESVDSQAQVMRDQVFLICLLLQPYLHKILLLLQNCLRVKNRTPKHTKNKKKKKKPPSEITMNGCEREKGWIIDRKQCAINERRDENMDSYRIREIGKN